MSRIQIQGFYPLKGRVSIQGSKNAVLPMMAAALLHRGITVLANVPFIEDVECMKGILKIPGAAAADRKEAFWKSTPPFCVPAPSPIPM